MVDVLKQSSWVLLLRGIIALILALLLLFIPELTLATGVVSFVVLFAIYALIDGASNVIGAIMRREGQWVLLLLWGVVSMIAGAVALGNPLIFGVLTLTIFVYIVAFRSIMVGVVEIAAAWQLRRELDTEWLLAVNGIFSVVFGIILLARPITGIEVLILLTVLYLLMAGVMQMILGIKARSWSKALPERLKASAT